MLLLEPSIIVYLSNVLQLCSIILNKIICRIHSDSYCTANCRVIPVGTENTELLIRGLNPEVIRSKVRKQRIGSFQAEMEMEHGDKRMLFRE